MKKFARTSDQIKRQIFTIFLWIYPVYMVLFSKIAHYIINNLIKRKGYFAPTNCADAINSKICCNHNYLTIESFLIVTQCCMSNLNISNVRSLFSKSDFAHPLFSKPLLGRLMIMI